MSELNKLTTPSEFHGGLAQFLLYREKERKRKTKVKFKKKKSSYWHFPSYNVPKSRRKNILCKNPEFHNEGEEANVWEYIFSAEQYQQNEFFLFFLDHN